jgi:hypothetical protein
MSSETKPLLPKQQQSMPGQPAAMRPTPDHGEKSYKEAEGSPARRPSSPALTVASAVPWQSPLRGRVLTFWSPT